ncbi:TetR/AcrR family transcriptional regulator [Nocardia sp. NPDC051832]|uniref:TetR/AcrR family transcriptional regulator n=1 Tax=Nocardia sp. NPDC051832 TaxID=3155673 RepID=UPI003426EF92
MTPASGTSTPARRSERSRRAILDATFALVAERGYAKVTIESIAATAGVGKPTIYRWWSSKGVLTLDAISAKVSTGLGFPDTGDLVADLTTQMTGLLNLLNGDVGTVYRGVLAEAQSDPDLSAAVRQTITEPHSINCEMRLVKAIAAGQLRNDIPTRVMVEQLYAPIYYRLILGTAALDPAHIPDLLDNALTGLAPR